ncbi:MFS transporter [Bacillus sp. NP157]|nr:MFS transporter [Bacillus sp. NP157]
MYEKAYESQCAAVDKHSADPRVRRRCALTLFALALGSFCIGTSEFASMGILQLFAGDLHIDVPAGTHAITAYAFGVVIGAPVVTIAAARFNRRSLLLGLMALFLIGNVLSALAGSIGLLAVARFISGLPQGAYFGAGAVVASYIVGPNQGGKAFAIVMTGLTVATIIGSPLATFMGQHVGWRNTYLAVACIAALALIALYAWIPRTHSLDGGSVRSEFSSLRSGRSWGIMLVASLGVASIFAVYTFIGPIVTDVTHLNRGWIPGALALFGLGMTLGNLLGGELADRYRSSGLVGGFGCALIVLVILATQGAHPWVLMASLFAVGATMMAAIPTLQVHLTQSAPNAPTLMGAMNLASLNLANALGAWGGGLLVANDNGYLSAAWAGFALTGLSLVVFGVLQRTSRVAGTVNLPGGA